MLNTTLNPQLAHFQVYASWAFKSKSDAERVRKWMKAEEVTILGCSVHGYPDEKTYEQLDCEGFDVEEGKFTLTQQGAFWVLAWVATERNEVIRATLDEATHEESVQMYFSPVSLDEATDEDGDPLELEAYDPKTGETTEDPFDWGSR